MMQTSASAMSYFFQSYSSRPNLVITIKFSQLMAYCKFMDGSYSAENLIMCRENSISNENPAIFMQ